VETSPSKKAHRTTPGTEVRDGSVAGVPQLQLLPAAKRAPLTVPPEKTLRHAETQMLLNDYSQLPVMSGERTVHGLISWKSIGKAHVVGKAEPRVADCMDSEVQVLAADMPLLKAVNEIIEHEVVLVRDHSRKIVGIVTTTDLSVQLRDRTNAFLLVGNIERELRRLIGNRFAVEVLRSVVAPESGRVVNSVEDLSFGEYLRLLQVPEHWSRLGLKVEADVMLKRLEDVRKIRNAVMHFRSESATRIDLESLQLTETFLASLCPRRRRLSSTAASREASPM
jgi:CBS domain-containing protein